MEPIKCQPCSFEIHPKFSPSPLLKVCILQYFHNKIKVLKQIKRALKKKSVKKFENVTLIKKIKKNK